MSYPVGAVFYHYVTTGCPTVIHLTIFLQAPRHTGYGSSVSGQVFIDKYHIVTVLRVERFQVEE